MYRLPIVLVAVLSLLALAAPARALTIDPNLYCSAGSDPTTNSDTTGAAFSTPQKSLKLSDMSLTISSAIVHPINCYGDFLGGTNNNPTQEGVFNQVFNNSAFPYATVDTTAGASVVVGGQLTFTVTDIAAGGAGCNPSSSWCWKIQWSDVNSTPPNLPIEFDFGVTLRGSDEEASYLFAPIIISPSPNNITGNFIVDFSGNGGTPTPALLSNLYLFGRVPEPASMALLGTSLFGLVALRRRRRS